MPAQPEIVTNQPLHERLANMIWTQLSISPGLFSRKSQLHRTEKTFTDYLMDSSLTLSPPPQSSPFTLPPSAPHLMLLLPQGGENSFISFMEQNIQLFVRSLFSYIVRWKVNGNCIYSNISKLIKSHLCWDILLGAFPALPDQGQICTCYRAPVPALKSPPGSVFAL